ncbi:MAG TPA: efflux RND transporter periplasmic adaptor subunit [Burkholderiales bacterium]|nr:efflux RND transporter periplasmic adaptor subunit [Burkholderiales bacterium]
MSTRHKIFAAGSLLVVAAAIVVVLYFARDGGANERRAPRSAPAVAVTVATAERRDVPVNLRAIGNVEAFASVAVRARVDGQIVAVEFTEGREVGKGAVLFRIDPRPYEAALRQAQANAMRDAAARDQARSQDRRYQELLAKNFVSKEAYAQIATNAATAEATARASQAALENARLNLEYCTIRAPLDGFPGKVLLQAGNMVRASDANPLVVINQVRPVYVNFAVPEQALPEIRRHQAAAPLSAEALDAATGAAIATGRLVFVDNAVDPATGTIRLRAQFTNTDAALWPGQFVNLRLNLYRQAGAVVVPAQAVQNGPDGQYVYLVGADMTAQVRRIGVQRTEGEIAVVAEGLAGGELVVTRGQLRLGPNVKVQIAKPAPERPT